jgi:hypothetical protein
LDVEVGKTYDKSDVKEMIKKVQTEKLEKAGYKNIVNNSISDSTLMNYSALLALCNHVADELRFLQDSDSLLPPNPYNFFQCTRFPMREGAYLYYDGNKGSFIRSGKVTRRGFAVRGKEHFDESKKVKSSTHFYDLFPLQLVSENQQKRNQWYIRKSPDDCWSWLGSNLLLCKDAGQKLGERWSFDCQREGKCADMRKHEKMYDRNGKISRHVCVPI